MPSPLERLPSIVAGAFGNGLFKQATLYRLQERTPDGRGGSTRLRLTEFVQAMVVDFSDQLRAANNIPTADRQILLLGLGLVPPIPGDTLVIDAQAWTFVETSRDPSGAVYTMQGKPSEVPATSLSGSINRMLGALRLSATAYQPSLASAALTLGPLGLVSTASPVIKADVALTLGPIILNSFGTEDAVAVVNLTLGRLTLSSTASQTAVASVAATLAPLALSSTAGASNAANAALTLAPLTLSSIAYQPALASVAVTLGRISLVASGAQTPGGDMNATLAPITLAAMAYQTAPAALAATIGPLSLVSTASQTLPASVALTLAPLTLAASGAQTLFANANLSLGSLTLSSVGYQTSAASVAMTLAPLALTSTAAPEQKASVALTLGALSVASFGCQPLLASVAMTLGALTLSSTATTEEVAAGTVTLGALTLSSTASQTLPASVALTLGALTLSSSATMGSVDAALTLGALSLSSTASQTHIASAGLTLGALSLSSAAIQTHIGSFNRSLSSLLLSSTAIQTHTADVAMTLAPLTLSATASGGTTAVAKDTQVSFNHTTQGQSPISGSITVGSNSNRALFIFIMYNGTPGSDSGFAVTVGGNAATLVQSTNSGGDNGIMLYKYLNPSTGSNSISFTHSDASFVGVITAISMYNVHQTTPLSTPKILHWPYSQFPSDLGIGFAGVTDSYPLGAIGFLENNTTSSATAWDVAPKTTPNNTTYFAGAISAGSSVTSRTPAAPSSTNFPRAIGDLEIAVCSKENSATDSCSSSGWNKLDQQNSSTAWSQSIYWRIYNGTNVDPVISWTGAADADAVRYCFKNVQNSGTPVKTLGTPANGTTTTHTSTGGNTTQAKSVAVYLDSCNANTAIAQPSGWTEMFDAGSATGPCRQAAGFKAVATSGGASGNISVTGGATRWIQSQIEILAASLATTEITNYGGTASGINQNCRLCIGTQAYQANQQIGFTTGAQGGFSAESLGVNVLAA